MKFGTRICLKPSTDRGEVQLDRAKSKNNIAENSFTLGLETYNTYTIAVYPIVYWDTKWRPLKYVCGIMKNVNVDNIF